MEDEMEDMIAQGTEIPRKEGEQVGVIIQEPQSAARYADYLAAQLGTDLSGLKLVVDCANGAASAIAPKLFQQLGAEVVAIHCEPNGVNINYKCCLLYTSDDSYIFMDEETFEQQSLNKEQLGAEVKYLKENMVLSVLFYQGTVSYTHLDVYKRQPILGANCA